MEQIMHKISLMMLVLNDDDDKICGFIRNIIYVSQHMIGVRVREEVVAY